MIYVYNRTLASATCAEAWSTAHVSNALVTRQVELGYTESWTGSSHQWDVFEEGINGSVIHGPNNLLAIGSGCWDRFKVNNVFGTNKWNFYFASCGGTLGQIGDTWDLGFSHAYAFGETGRWDFSATTAQDHQKGLLSKICTSTTCTWSSWGDNLDPNGSNYGYDHIDGWKWNRTANDEYTVVQCTKPC